jgi:hypothetical protein
MKTLWLPLAWALALGAACASPSAPPLLPEATANLPQALNLDMTSRGESFVVDASATPAMGPGSVFEVAMRGMQPVPGSPVQATPGTLHRGTTSQRAWLLIASVKPPSASISTLYAFVDIAGEQRLDAWLDQGGTFTRIQGP